MKRATGRLVAGGLGIAGVLLVGPSPARAACIEVDFAVHHSGEPDYYPLGPDYCVTDTPWNQTDHAWYDHTFAVPPAGIAIGVYVDVSYTSP